MTSLVGLCFYYRPNPVRRRRAEDGNKTAESGCVGDDVFSHDNCIQFPLGGGGGLSPTPGPPRRQSTVGGHANYDDNICTTGSVSDSWAVSCQFTALTHATARHATPLISPAQQNV